MPSLSLGHSTVSNETFSLCPANSDNHMAVFGITGVGKITFMVNLMTTDIYTGAGDS